MPSDDYPPEYQRFTVKRIYRYILAQMSAGRVDMSHILTHRLPIGRIRDACDLVLQKDRSALGEVIASVSGRSYAQYVNAHILDPLGMTRTGFSHTTEMNAAEATPYQKRWSVMTAMMRLMLPRGSFGPAADGFVAFNRFYLDGAAYGGLVGSLEDAARFLRMHLRGGELDGRRILSPESTITMQTIATLGTPRDLGLGWFRPHKARAGERRFVEHLGGGGGFWNCMRIYPDASLGVIMMGNATSYDHEAIARTVADCWWS